MSNRTLANVWDTDFIVDKIQELYKALTHQEFLTQEDAQSIELWVRLYSHNLMNSELNGYDNITDEDMRQLVCDVITHNLINLVAEWRFIYLMGENNDMGMEHNMQSANPTRTTGNTLIDIGSMPRLQDNIKFNSIDIIQQKQSALYRLTNSAIKDIYNELALMTTQIY